LKHWRHVIGGASSSVAQGGPPALAAGVGGGPLSAVAPGVLKSYKPIVQHFRPVPQAVPHKYRDKRGVKMERKR